jgi:hypothetical protein
MGAVLDKAPAQYVSSALTEQQLLLGCWLIWLNI